VVVVVTVGASEEGIDQIMWMLRPSKLAGVLPPIFPARIERNRERAILERAALCVHKAESLANQRAQLRVIHFGQLDSHPAAHLNT
jgi:hypothetical protein